jgi:hypothetical protein
MFHGRPAAPVRWPGANGWKLVGALTPIAWSLWLLVTGIALLV